MMIWDGKRFRNVDDEKGARLIAEGKAQDMRTTDGFALKTYKELKPPMVPLEVRGELPRGTTYLHRQVVAEGKT